MEEKLMSKSDETQSGAIVHESARGLSLETIADMKAHIALLTEAQQTNQKKHDLLSKIVLGDGKPHEGIVWILEENRVALTNIGQQLEKIREDQKIFFGYNERLKIVEAHVATAHMIQQTLADTVKKWIIGVLIATTMAIGGFVLGHLDIKWSSDEIKSMNTQQTEQPSVAPTPVAPTCTVNHAVNQ